MEIKTTVQEMSGSYYVRIPSALVEYLRLKKTFDAKIKDIAENKVEITFPLW